ncbi:pyrimidine reductase family protein [Streptomyces sp. SID13031]|uniref:pyrimidine reductase family protein n=1 Tax=Streptomyces sp. SID13031 TaxID=2706046 RepID=UPI0019404150|nr:pyrimidine reductase family protein [Streptomyces sp. SID13031]
MRRWSADGNELTGEELIAAYAVPDRSARRLRANFVTSIDGAVTLDGLSGGLSSKDDQNLLGLLRMLADVVLVGAGTLRAEQYNGLRLGKDRRVWRAEQGWPENPVLAVVSARLDLSPGSSVFTEAPVRPIVITCESAPAQQRKALAEVADVLACGDDEVDLTKAVAELAERGLSQILCEGGPHLLGSLTSADLVDEMCLTVSPVLAGPGARRITDGIASTQVHHLDPLHVLNGSDGYLFLRYGRS